MRIWAFTVRHWQFTLLVFGFAVALGISALRSIPRSEDPVFPIPLVTVIAVYPGADPADVERLIVDPIEDAMNELDDVDNIESESRDGLGVVNVEFTWGTDPEEKYDEVVREVNALRAELPEGLASLDIRKASTGLVNIVQVALVSEKESYRELESRAEDLREAIGDRSRSTRGRNLGVPGARGCGRGRSRAARAPCDPARRRDCGHPRRQRRHPGRRRRRRRYASTT